MFDSKPCFLHINRIIHNGVRISILVRVVIYVPTMANILLAFVIHPLLLKRKVAILTPRSLDALTVVMEATSHGDIDVMALLIVIMEVMRSTVKISNSKPRKYHV